MKTIVKNVHLVPMGYANAYLVEAGDEVALIDAGFPDKQQEVFSAMKALGRPVTDLKHIVFTHGHPDHIGSAAAIVAATGARTYMHEADVAAAEAGGPFRPMRAASGLLQRLMFRFFWHPAERTAPFRIDHKLRDGDRIDVAGGFEVVHVPGHSAGHVVLRWKDGEMLFAGDVGTNLFSVGDPVGFEDERQGKQSQRRVAQLVFSAIAFGHGKPITKGAAQRLRAAWA